MAETSDVFADFAARVGIDPQQARDGIAAILQALQQALSPETFEQVVASIPQGPELLAQAKQGGASLWGALAGMAGQLVGAAEQSQILGNALARLSELGISPEQLQKFLAESLEFFRQHLPADLVEQVSNLLRGGPSGNPAGDPAGNPANPPS